MKTEIKPSPLLPTSLRRLHGAIGKALIVWMASGSLLAAVVAYFLLSSMGC